MSHPANIRLSRGNGRSLHSINTAFNTSDDGYSNTDFLHEIKRILRLHINFKIVVGHLSVKKTGRNMRGKYISRHKKYSLQLDGTDFGATSLANVAFHCICQHPRI
ncbi:uncharacterized protein LOC143928010 [Lithobates pipiens]